MVLLQRVFGTKYSRCAMEQTGNLGKQHDDSLFFPLFNPSCPESFALTIIYVNVINYVFTEHSRLVIGGYSMLLFKMKSNNITLHSQLFCHAWDCFNKPVPHILHHPEPISQFFEPSCCLRLQKTALRMSFMLTLTPKAELTITRQYLKDILDPKYIEMKNEQLSYAV